MSPAVQPGAGGPAYPKGFSPVNMTIVIGVNNTVTWTNDDAFDHTVTALSGLFNSQNIQPGGVFRYTFTRPGAYVYGCEYHPLMRGMVTVKG